MFEGINTLTETITKTISEDGVKVVADVDDDVYLKLGATIIAAVIVSAIGFYIVQSLFK